jgi:hypothetical protein
VRACCTRSWRPCDHPALCASSYCTCLDLYIMVFMCLTINPSGHSLTIFTGLSTLCALLFGTLACCC